jgi:hypothetical protein
VYLAAANASLPTTIIKVSTNSDHEEADIAVLARYEVHDQAS